ncbi:MAG: hypothetical protein JSU65_10940 [Candidatus Zixiibacteriota bacterium]|nr:MAG: hypothetical protein JSU65_10940 [candidate division Zixibacteria bacterium]
MVRRTLTVFSIMILAAGPGLAADALECAFSVSQLDPVDGRQVLLYSDTSRVLKGTSVVGTFVAFSVDLQITDLDSAGASFMVHVVTIGQPPSNYSRRFKVEYNLPAALDGIQGKGDAEYTFTIVPLALVDVDTTGCGWMHTASDDFKVDPSAHFNIYYVPFTHGDFYWNSVKGLMETEYRQFRDLNRFTLPGKYSLFLCPCRIPSVIWDKRFGMMVDPTRNILFSVYNTVGNTTDPFLALHVSILRNYGYAPPFISEGFAGYLSDAPWAMKRIREAGQDPSLDELLDTYSYFQWDPYIADRSSATFVRYLIEEYKITRFLELYRMADHLNLRSSLETVYGRTISELDQAWKTYIDTITVKFGQLQQYADQAEVLFRHELVEDYGKSMLAVAKTHRDSVDAVARLARTSLFSGEYYDAISYQKQLMELNVVTSKVLMALGSFQMMAGYYHQAAEVLQRAKAADSTDQLVDFNIAMNHLHLGDKQMAQQILTGIVDFPTETSPQAEGRVILGNILMESDDPAIKLKATNYYHEAIALLGKTVRTSAPSAQQQLWNGIAHLGIDDTGAALDYLETALYLETRAFYTGMIYLWLGKLADVRGERDVARHYYGKVLSHPSADYHQQEARRLLDNPYHH